MFSFVFWMLIASSLGLIKLLTLILILDPADYGRYVSVFGLAMLAGALGSFGQIERTVKIYPRMVAEGSDAKIISDAVSTFKTLLLRFILLLCHHFG